MWQCRPLAVESFAKSDPAVECVAIDLLARPSNSLEKVFERLNHLAAPSAGLAAPRATQVLDSRGCPLLLLEGPSVNANRRSTSQHDGVMDLSTHGTLRDHSQSAKGAVSSTHRKNFIEDLAGSGLRRTRVLTLSCKLGPRRAPDLQRHQSRCSPSVALIAITDNQTVKVVDSETHGAECSDEPEDASGAVVHTNSTVAL